MGVLGFLGRGRIKKCVERNNQKLLDAGLVAMRYKITGRTIELGLNGRVLMIFGMNPKSRAAIDSTAALCCLFRNLNAIDLPKLKEIAFESALNSF